MLYRVTEHNGDVMKEKEYEGTPQEIAELIKKLDSPKVTDTKLNVKVPNLSEAIKQATERISEEARKGTRAKGIR